MPGSRVCFVRRASSSCFISSVILRPARTAIRPRHSSGKNTPTTPGRSGVHQFIQLHPTCSSLLHGKVSHHVLRIPSSGVFFVFMRVAKKHHAPTEGDGLWEAAWGGWRCSVQSEDLPMQVVLASLPVVTDVPECRKIAIAECKRDSP